MAMFYYDAYEKDGSRTSGELDAVSENEVARALSRRGQVPVSIRTIHKRKILSSLGSFGRIAEVDILFLVRNLGTALRAGLTVTDALDILITDSEKGAVRRMLTDVLGAVKNGAPLSRAFEPFRKNFPLAFIGMLRAGELTGSLDTTLESLGEYLRREFSLASRVRSALIYPAVLLVASFGVVFLLMTVVLPRLSNLFSSSAVALPLVTRIFIGTSNILSASITLDLVVIGLIIVGLLFLRRTEGGRRAGVAILGRLPIAHDIMRKVALARFARTFGVLIRSGASALEALGIARESVGNIRYEEAIRAAERGLEGGAPLSRTLSAYPDLFPSILLSLVRVGEQTGKLGDILVTLADFYDEEVENRLKDLTTVLEPLLLVIMGLFVGAIALAVLLPIYQLVGKFT